MSTTSQYPTHIASLRPYVPGLPISDLARRLDLPETQIAKLASNENPFGASPRALQALAASSLDYSRYPDNECTELTQTLASHYAVPANWIVVGAGSESVIGNAVATFLEVGRTTAFSQYSFQAYVNAAQRVGAKAMVIPSPEYRVDLDGLRRSFEAQPSLIYIANPGNPTGTCLDPQELYAFLKTVPPHIGVILDEAYYEFLPMDKRGDSVAWVREFPNLLVTRTFSKAYGLAGLRVGYGLAQTAMADMLRRVRPPFTVTQHAQVAAAAALTDEAFLRKTLENNNACRKELVIGLKALGFDSLESHTNFVMAKVGNGADWNARLERHGLIVRPVNSYALPEWIRISIGTEEETARLLNAFRAEVALTT
ncbi:MAG: histidinol-phosphate transaminase [Burkholderiaceae bacterium]|nr:histidinol-phosphate transaminase [Burkholderiaceae bacterium]